MEKKYANANVLILGGGDGGLLKELLELENPPAHVTMVDIDEDVLIACSKHIPSVCGDYLEKRRGQNFSVIVGDAMKAMAEYKVLLQTLLYVLLFKLAKQI